MILSCATNSVRNDHCVVPLAISLTINSTQILLSEAEWIKMDNIDNVDNIDNIDNIESIESTDDADIENNEDNIENIDSDDNIDNYINITDFMEIKERLEKIESLTQKLNSFKSSLSNHEIFLYDSLHELKKGKSKFDRISRISVINIFKSAISAGKSVADEKKIRLDYVLGNREYKELRQSAGNIKRDISFIETEIESERDEIARLKNQNKRSMSYIDYMYEPGRKSFLNTTHEQQLSDLKNKEKEMLEIIEIGRKISVTLNESRENIIKADNYWNDRRKDFADFTGFENIKTKQAALYQILFSGTDKNDYIRKAGTMLYHLVDTIKSFTSAIYNINQNQLSYIAVYEIKDYDIAIDFIDYFHACIFEDVRNKKDFKQDSEILDNMSEKIHKIIGELEDLKSVITDKLEHLNELK